MQKKIYIAGHQGMVGSALFRLLSSHTNVDIVVKTHSQLDLLDQAKVISFFESERFDEVYLAAAKVGGIYANKTYPAEFIYDNLMIQANVINAAYQSGVAKLLLLGSSCIYPRLAEQPMAESALLTGELEPTNEPYAVAKIAGIKLCESYNRQYDVDYRSVMPTNLYGQNDNFHPENSHVIPAMIDRFHKAKVQGSDSVAVWGSGKPKREFLYVDDMAQASVHIMNLSKKAYENIVNERVSHINVGAGVDCSIYDLASLIKKVVGFDGGIVLDQTKPDGAPRKLLDVSLLNELGWKATIDLELGLSKTYKWYLDNASNLRGFRAAK